MSIQLTSQSINDQFDDAKFLLAEMEALWVSRGGDAGLKDILLAKCDSPTSQITGLVFYDDKKPVGLAWGELTSINYGSMTYHSQDPKYRSAIVDMLVNQGFYDDVIMETVTMEETQEYVELLRAKKLTQNARHRMSTWLMDHDYFEIPTLPYQFYFYNDEYIDDVAKISVLAHRVSHDYDMYPELVVESRRLDLEKKVLSGHYGPVVQSGSLMVFDGDTLIGYCLVVEIPCWGYERVPWYFDVIVHPDYHSKGIGSAMFMQSLNQLKEKDFDLVGLAVTQNNFAKKLYDKTGFTVVDDFYEFVNEVTPRPVY